MLHYPFQFPLWKSQHVLKLPLSMGSKFWVEWEVDVQVQQETGSIMAPQRTVLSGTAEVPWSSMGGLYNVQMPNVQMPREPHSFLMDLGTVSNLEIHVLYPPWDEVWEQSPNYL